MSDKKQYPYFISYNLFNKIMEFGTGNTNIMLLKKITSIDHVREIEEYIKKHIEANRVIVTNWILLGEVTEVLDQINHIN